LNATNNFSQGGIYLGASILPWFHGRHNGRGNVLWYDMHVTGETPWPILEPTLLNATYAARYLELKANNIGLLTPVERSVPQSQLLNQPNISWYYSFQKPS